jgi:hypothetical protein
VFGQVPSRSCYLCQERHIYISGKIKVLEIMRVTSFPTNVYFNYPAQIRQQRCLRPQRLCLQHQRTQRFTKVERIEALPFQVTMSEVTNFSLLMPSSGLSIETADTSMLSQQTIDHRTTAAATFDPVLNVSALVVFVLITGIFLALQWRVSAIEAAAENRTVALQRLRTIKVAELGDPTITPEQVQAAVREYELAYNEVETLRTILPGVRVIPPPSQSFSQERQKDNEAAAKKFLGVEQPQIEELTGTANNQQSMSPILTAILILIAFSQLALLALFVTTDPMLSSLDTVNNVLNTME